MTNSTSRHKYGAVAVTVDGHRFPSKAEARRYGELRLLEQAGAIRDLELQPRFPLVVNGARVAVYVADFRYAEVGSRRVIVEDVKGVRTPLYRLKKRLVKVLYGVDVQEVRA